MLPMSPSRALLVLAGAAAAGCVALPQLPEGGSYPAIMATSDVGAAISSSTATAKEPAAAAAAPGAGPRTDAAITNSLLALAETRDRFRPDLSKAQDTPLAEVLSVGSPIGYELRTRFLNLGIPIGEALSRDSDPVFRERLKMMARWENDNETRPMALIALAKAHDPSSIDVFREALVHLDPAVRFGALEALQVWGHPDKALPLLDAASQRDSDPLLRVYAAGGLARLGAPEGLTRLRASLGDPGWLVRAMAARYLGEVGTADDYRLLVSKIGGEANNDFVVAEYCIAALKLFPKTAL